MQVVHAMKTLDLSISSFSVQLSKFTQYERLTPDTGQTEYSIAGTPLDSGPVYEPKHLWNVTAMVTWAQYSILHAIFQESDSRRRNQQDYRILVGDRIQNYVEVGSRTRGIAPGGTEVNIGGAIAYPAQFHARMFEPRAEFQRNSYLPYQVSFVLRELDKKNA